MAFGRPSKCGESEEAPLATTAAAVSFNPLLYASHPLPLATTFLIYLNLLIWAEIPTERTTVVPVYWSLKVS